MVTRLIILLALIALLVGGCVWQERRVSAAEIARDQALAEKIQPLPNATAKFSPNCDQVR